MVTSRVEFWWIHSPAIEAWAGLRIATFFEVDGFPTFMIHNETSDRAGPRDWRRISELESWSKIERIEPPIGFRCREPEADPVE